MRCFLCSFPQPHFILWYTLCTVCQCHCHLQVDGLLTAILPRVVIEFSQQEPSLLTHTTINSEIAGGQNTCCCKLIFKAQSFRSHLPGSRGIYHWNIIITAATSINPQKKNTSLSQFKIKSSNFDTATTDTVKWKTKTTQDVCTSSIHMV